MGSGSSALDLSVYILNYSSISPALVEAGELTVVQHCRLILHGILDRKLLENLDVYVEKGWSMPGFHNADTVLPDFEALNSVALLHSRYLCTRLSEEVIAQHF